MASDRPPEPSAPKAPVFLSYRRPDTVRVHYLLHRLRLAGLPITWDREFPAGVDWEPLIEKWAREASCVLVCWTETSVVPKAQAAEGSAACPATTDYFAMERRIAKSCGTYFGVCLDGVNPPDGFDLKQASLLGAWWWLPANPNFLDLVDALRARIEGQPPPTPRGPRVRRLWAYKAGILAIGLPTLFLGLGLNAFGIQDGLCSLSLPGDPYAIADVCGDLSLGGKPTRDERLAYDAIQTGDCEGLRAFVSAHHTSPLLPQAQARLDARTQVYSPDWQPHSVQTQGYIRQSPAPAATHEAALDAARAQVEPDVRAGLVCAADEHTRFLSVTIDATTPSCEQTGLLCGLTYTATCHMERHPIVDHCP